MHTTIPGIRVPRLKLARVAEIVLRARGIGKSVSLILVADDTMRRLNRRFRRQDKTTDVLSFALDDDADPLLGEIYISVPEARRNAAECGRALTAEILHLFCHGLLHLAGVHHPDAKARAEMMRLEERYLSQVEKGPRR
jgi:rRNA maturation RNase YbeY